MYKISLGFWSMRELGILLLRFTDLYEQLSYFDFQLIVCGQIGVHVVFHVDMGFKLDIGNKKLKMVEKIVLEML